MIFDALTIDGHDYLVPSQAPAGGSAPTPAVEPRLPVVRVTTPCGRFVARMTAERAAAHIAAGRVVEVLS